MSGRWSYKFNSGAAEWLEKKNVFMRTMKFLDRDSDIPVGFLARTRKKFSKIDLSRFARI